MDNEIREEKSIDISEKGEIVLYEPDSSIRLEVRMANETVWLNLNQMAMHVPVSDTLTLYNVLWRPDESDLKTTDDILNRVRNNERDIRGYSEDVFNEEGGAKMILLEPRAFSESQQIADHLKRRNTVVVNLNRVTSDQAKRIVDFLSGTI